MTGQEINNITLTPGMEMLLQFSSDQQIADIMNYGPGDVFLSWRKAAVIADGNCLQLAANGTYEIRTAAPWRNLSIIGATASILQVVTR